MSDEASCEERSSWVLADPATAGGVEERLAAVEPGLEVLRPA